MADGTDGRDLGVDALRALAIAGVVTGHWLVTAWVPGGADRLVISSPLAFLPGLTPLSWLLQTLAVFFLVAGFAAARRRRSGGGRGRAARSARPLALLLALWAAFGVGLILAGLPVGSFRALALPTLGPLWFLGVFTLLSLAAPALTRARRGSPLAVVAACAAGVVAVGDIARFAGGAPAWAGWPGIVAAWLVPYVLGVAWGQGRRVVVLAPWLLGGGVAATAVLVVAFGYPASMVGVTGAPVSNLSPPTLAAVTFGVAQAGLAMLLHAPLTRLMRRRRPRALVGWAGRAAVPIYLWHQTALTLPALGAFLAGGAPGLIGEPSGLTWVAWRLAWLPVAAGLLALLLRVSRRPAAATGPPGPRPA